MRNSDNHQNPAIWKGVVAGIAGGLVASWTMNQVFTLWSKLSKSRRQKQTSDVGEQKEPATIMLAKKISKGLLHHELTEQEKKIAEPAVHYGFGAAMGALYGGLAEYEPQVRTGLGTAYGSALFVVADEIAVPALGLSGKATKAPVSSHALGFTAHIVYGITTELVRKGVRRALAA